MPYRRAPGVRLRPVVELRTCLAFTMTPPRLHTLNATAWLIAELADGQAEAELEAAFLARSVPPLAERDARRHLAEGLASLCASRILESVPEEEKAA